ncbi:nucleolar protein 9 isoform X2 [Nylanderia fulva]|uniref:nucleolar protein 9 isoform X2 n=1 Tax=Nylanderia fulva TaxID=613905 RepID=UPI0010FB22AA|nr:nucleolar protein 9 isoform X2 [Nylanderia fulva]
MMGSQEAGKKRKKKRSQTQMAKKFARRRNSGNDLDQDTYQYMNVFQETAGREVDCARNQIGSHVIDSLLKYASLEAIQKLIEAFEPSLRLLSSDKCASHVLQKIILVCADRGNQVSTSITNKAAVVEIKPLEAKTYNDIVLRLSKYFLNNLEEFVFDTYANHVLRTVIKCLAGLIDDNESNKKSFVQYSVERRPVIQEYKDLLIESCDRLQKWPQFYQFGQQEITSGFVQCILHSLKDVDPDLTNAIIKKIRKICFNTDEEEKLSNIFNAESSIRILEACLTVAQSKTFIKLYKTYFAKNLKHLCLTQNTNFSVQRLLDYCVTKELFEEIFDKVSEYFPEILQQGFTGIFVSAGNACLRLQTKQGAFINSMIKLLKCDTSTDDQTQLVRCIVTLKDPDQLKAIPNNSQPLNLHGSLIIQAILNFNKPIKIANSLLEMSNEELLQLFNDPKGSRILDAFMDSKYIGEKSREKLCKKLHGIWAELAKSTHGSRCVDKMWIWARMNQKVLIMEELAAAGKALESTKSGKIISAKLNVPLFARNKKDWSESQGKEEKTKALFADIIGKNPKK